MKRILLLLLLAGCTQGESPTEVQCDTTWVRPDSTHTGTMQVSYCITR